jgi:hypothetical protein
MTYTVFIEEMSRYQSEDGRYKHGEFETYESAVAACMKIVDEFLEKSLEGDMGAADLFRAWSLFGEDPYIVPDQDPGFSAMDYARSRCGEILSK